MFMNKVITYILIIINFCIVQYDIFASSNSKSEQCKIVEVIFSKIVENKIFTKDTDSYWNSYAIEFFYKVSPQEVRRFSDRISFPGEFLRFLRKDIVGPTNKRLVRFNILPASGESYYFDFVDGKARNSKFIEKCYMHNIVFQFLIIKQTVLSKMNNSKRVYFVNNDYLYVAGLLMENKEFKFNIPSFLTNKSLPLENKQSSLKFIDKNLIIRFQKWLLSQINNYSDIKFLGK